MIWFNLGWNKNVFFKTRQEKNNWINLAALSEKMTKTKGIFFFCSWLIECLADTSSSVD